MDSGGIDPITNFNNNIKHLEIFIVCRMNELGIETLDEEIKNMIGLLFTGVKVEVNHHEHGTSYLAINPKTGNNVLGIYLPI